MRPSPETLVRRYRIAMAIFLAGLMLSGVTAFPLLTEMRLLAHMLGIAESASPADHDGLYQWISTVRHGLEESYAQYPWIAYGTDWLAFAHLVVALFFIGPLIDPRSARANLLAGSAACVGVIPLALIAGAIREVPLFSRLIDCSFGVIGLALLLYCLRLQREIAAEPMPG